MSRFLQHQSTVGERPRITALRLSLDAERPPAPETPLFRQVTRGDARTAYVVLYIRRHTTPEQYVQVMRWAADRAAGGLSLFDLLVAAQWDLAWLLEWLLLVSQGQNQEEGRGDAGGAQ